PGGDAPLPLTGTEDRLRKVLELERVKRFSDRAVTSGLDIFLTNIGLHEATQIAPDVSARMRALPPEGYRALTPVRRRQWVEGTLDVLRSRNGRTAGGAGGSGKRAAVGGGSGKREAGGGNAAI